MISDNRLFITSQWWLPALPGFAWCSPVWGSPFWPTALRRGPGASMKASPALRLENLSVSFGDVPAVQDLSFDLAPGATLGIVGESGSGKSISLRALMGILPSAATINNGRLWAASDEIPLSGKRFGRVAGAPGHGLPGPVGRAQPGHAVGDLIARCPGAPWAARRPIPAGSPWI